MCIFSAVSLHFFSSRYTHRLQCWHRRGRQVRYECLEFRERGEWIATKTSISRTKTLRGKPLRLIVRVQCNCLFLNEGSLRYIYIPAITCTSLHRHYNIKIIDVCLCVGNGRSAETI